MSNTIIGGDGSKTSMTQPYLRLSFWMNHDNHWWNQAIYSQKTKDRMIKIIENVISQERNISKP